MASLALFMTIWWWSNCLHKPIQPHHTKVYITQCATCVPANSDLPVWRDGHFLSEVLYAKSDTIIDIKAGIWSIKICPIILSIIFLLAFLVVWVVSRKVSPNTRRVQKLHKKATEKAKRLLLKYEKARSKNSSLKAQNNQLQLSNTEKTEMIDIVAHDLKTPIHQILGVLKLISLSGNLSAEELEQYHKMIAKSAEGALLVVHKVLSAQTIAQGVDLKREDSLSLMRIVSEKVKGYRIAAQEKQINIDFSPDLRPWQVIIDRIYFQQIFDNLVSNAIKYSPMGKTVKVKLLAKHNQMRLEVKDQGPGFEKEDLQRLFSKYKTLSAQPTAGEDATGLGLSIVKRLCQEMNGDISIDSDLDKGTTFIVTFPLEQTAVHPPTTGTGNMY